MTKSKRSDSDGELTRRLEDFFERSSSLILDHARLNRERLGQLREIARQVGLTDRQLRDELRGMQERGILKLEPGLLSSSATSKSTHQDPQPSANTPSPEPPVDSRQAPPDSADALPASPTTEDAENRPQRAPEAPDSTESNSSASGLGPSGSGRMPPGAAKRRQRFVEEGSLEDVPPPPESVDGWAVTKDEIGVDDSLQGPPTQQERLSAEAAIGLPGRPKMREATPRGPLPFDVFREYVHEWKQRSDREIDADLQAKLIETGVKKFGLSQVLARHIVRDVLGLDARIDSAAMPAPQDQRFDQFFERVAPILALHRGLNSQSRMLITAIAQEVGLSDAELENALGQLQRRAPQANLIQMERREAFRVYLRRALAKLGKGIISRRVEKKLVEAGLLFHGVEPDQIKPLINQVAIEMGFRFVTDEQAVEHIQQLIERKYGNHEYLDHKTRSQIYTEGDAWGLSPIDVEQMIRQAQGQRRFRIRVRKIGMRWGVALLVLATMGSLAWLTWYLVQRQANEPFVEPLSEQTEAPRGAAWWTDRMQIAFVRLKDAHPTLAPVFAGLQSPQGNNRTSAYKQFLKLGLALDLSRDHRRRFQDFLVDAVASEPDQEVALQLAEQVLGSLSDSQISNSHEQVERIERLASVPDRWLDSLPSDSPRFQQVIQKINFHFAAQVDLEANADLKQVQYWRALAQLTYDRLAQWDDSQTPLMLVELRTMIRPRLEESELDQLELRLLRHVLSKQPRRWEAYVELLYHLLDLDDRDVILALVDLWENVKDPAFQDFVRARWGHETRFGFDERSTRSVAELAEEVRQLVGGTELRRSRQRLDLLDRMDRLPTAIPESSTGFREYLQLTIDLAQFNTLSSAHAMGDAGTLWYNRWVDRGRLQLPPEELERAPRRAPAASPLVDEQLNSRRLVQSAVSDLEQARSGTQRLQAVREVAAQVARLPELDPASGRVIAKYLLAPKSDREQQDLLPMVRNLSGWRFVRMGIVDQLDDSMLRDQQVRETLAEVFGPRLTAESTTRDLRRHVLRQAAGVASSTDELESNQPVLDATGRLLSELYHTQAVLRGLPLEWSEDVPASEMLMALIEVTRQQLLKASVTASERRFLNRFLERDALLHAAQSDPQRTLMLQRLWFRLLAIETRLQVPARTQLIQQWTEQVQREQRDAARLVQQLALMERAIQQLWRMQLEVAEP